MGLHQRYKQQKKFLNEIRTRTNIVSRITTDSENLRFYWTGSNSPDLKILNSKNNLKKVTGNYET